MDWIDAHCHLSDARIAPKSLGSLLNECRQAGITRFVLGGVSPEEWDRQVELVQAHPGVFFAVFGLHPWKVDEVARQSEASASLDRVLSELEKKLPSASALGETGLDAARDRFKKSRQLQLRAFEAQLALAAGHNKPAVLHIVRAHPLALETLKSSQSRPATLMIHSFSGTWAEARQYLDLGCLLSISARVTYPDAHDLHETALKAPADRLVFETDAPDQPPYGAAEKVHTPLSLLKVVKKVSQIRSETPEMLLDRSRDTLLRAFSMKV